MAFAAQDFLVECDKTYGENIFKAIVEGHDERYVSDLKTIKENYFRFLGKQQDFIYPTDHKQMGQGSGKGAVAGMLDVEMTKAPWAK